MSHNLELIAKAVDPKARRSGNGYSVRCPVHEDKEPSAYIEIRNDRLLATCYAGCNQDEVFAAVHAKAKAGGLLNGWSRTNIMSEHDIKPRIPNNPAPRSASEPDFSVMNLGSPTGTWAYMDENAQVVGYVARFDTEKGKTFRQFRWAEGGFWEPKAMHEPRPLWNTLSLEPGAKVILVEGEKAAETLQNALGAGFSVLTWPGGASAWNKADFNSLAGMEVTLWPDNDHPGALAMDGITGILEGMGCRVSRLNPPSDKPQGWDASDLVNEGCQDIAGWIARYTACSPYMGTVGADLLSDTVPVDIIDRLISSGCVMFAGAPGAGKTTALVPLMARAAWLCRPDDKLRPTIRRRVIYVTEDVPQVRRILQSMWLSDEISHFKHEEIDDFFRIVEAKREKTADLVEKCRDLAKLSFPNAETKTGLVYMAPPVLVLDTRSAALDLEDENDNSVASNAVQTLRQGLPGINLIIVTHTAKAMNGMDASALTSRGAGAWEGDAQQVVALSIEPGMDKRWMQVGGKKNRLLAPHDGVLFTLVRNEVKRKNVLGLEVNVTLVHTFPSIVEAGERERMVQEAKDQAAENRKEGTYNGILEEVAGVIARWDHAFMEPGDPYSVCSKRSIIKRASGKNEQKAQAIDALEAGGTITRMLIPSALSEYLGRRGDVQRTIYVMTQERERIKQILEGMNNDV